MRRSRVYELVVVVLTGLFRLLGTRITVLGAGHLPTRGGAVIASNHISYLDFALVGHAARAQDRQVRFMAKKSLFERPVTGGLLRAMGHLPVDRWSGAGAYRQARRALGGGEIVGVFPEATISRSWRIKKLKPGAAALSLNGDLPLVPCILWGTHRLATVDRRPSLRRGVAVTIILGEPLLPRPDEGVPELTTRLRETMERMLDEAIDTYPDAPRDDADRWWVPHDRGGSAPDVETGAALDREALRRIGAPSD
ncbi:lysophospholipid acyltransferase family protein [Aeromicrobium sp. CTD01-1L150]|uniref:lysophospholipid acyltransferase family protein n=1 Tax=Aeromicrobium sp. CTD01-1L150 TaxID=3341830 RepID=UPI0035BF0830